MSRDEKVVGKMRVRGAEYAVTMTVFDRTGDIPTATFSIEGLSTNKHGHQINSPTWEGLYKLAMVATKRASAKISIPFMEEDTRDIRQEESPWKLIRRERFFRSGRIVGRQAGNNNPLLLYDDRPNQAPIQHISRGWSEEHFFRVMGKETQREYFRLVVENSRAEKALTKFRKTYQFDPTDEIEAEIEKTLSDQDREEA